MLPPNELSILLMRGYLLIIMEAHIIQRNIINIMLIVSLNLLKSIVVRVFYIKVRLWGLILKGIA